MVTFCFFLVFFLLLVVTTVFDMLIYKKSLFETLYMLLHAYIGAGRSLVYLGAALGLMSAMIIDYRLHKRKKMKKVSERKVS